MVELKDSYGVRKVAPNSKNFDRRSADEGTIRKDEPKQLKSFLSFTNAIPAQRAKLFKKKTSTDFTNVIPSQHERTSHELFDGSDANLLSSPNEAIIRKMPHRRRRSSTAIIKRHRRRRNLSGSDGDCRTVVLRRKRSRHQNGGVNAPPRHVHCNDWREMVTMTENISPRKSEGDLDALVNCDRHYDVNKQQQTKQSNATSFCSVNEQIQPEKNGTKQEFPYYNISQRALDNREKVDRLARVRNISGGSSIQHAWIDETFCKRECAVFIASSKDANKCGCGRIRGTHTASALSSYNPYDTRSKDHSHAEKWAISRHTLVLPTDSYGTIEFQGGPHPFKAQYLRLNFDTDPVNIMSLFEHVWQISPPKLIITVHGGITNFDLQPKLARVFRKGLLKAARTTGAWIFTTGINAGVVRHVAAALEGAISSSKSRSKIVTVGIAPWGLLRKREDLVGRDKVVSYHPHSFPPKGRFAVLNNRSSFFLLVDNGTIGRYGADIILRRRLESYIAEKQKIGSGGRSVPVVCVVLEGGTCTVRTVLDYVTRIPKVPVVVCDGSGRASDLLAFAHQYIQEDGNLPEGVRPQLLRLIEAVFFYDKSNAQCLVLDILACVRQKHMITIFRLGENQKQDVDYAILTALLKGQNLSPAEQLSLALAWNRVDIARSDIFVMGQDWPKASLHNAMLEALIHNRVDFVRLLLENGVSMHDFLTIGRLEELYNTDQGPPNTLYYIVRDVVKIRPGYHYKLVHIGMAVEKLMANGFRSHYTSSEFRHRYMSYRNKCKEVLRRKRELSCQRSAVGDCYSHVDDGTASTFAQNVPSIPPNNSSLHVENEASHVLPAISGSRALSNHILWRSAYRRDNFINPSTLMGSNLQQNKETVIDVEDELFYEAEEKRRDFKYPFSDLLIWAVLTKRHDMALCMWQHGEEAMAKALVACRLYKSLSKEAAEDYLEVEICEELKKYAEEFRLLSLDLLDHCYKQDDAQTLQLLTYELTYWGYETCLSLSVIVNNKQFLAHPCCQILLADLWHGGLRIRSNSNLKVIMGIIFPPSIFLLEFKSREELMLQPQTAAEHEQDINYSSSSSSSESSSSSSSSSDSESEDELSSTHADKHRHPLSTSGAALASADGGANTVKRRGSSTSVQSLNLAALFHSKRRKHHRSQNANNVMPATTSTPNRSGIEVKDKSNLSTSCENNYYNQNNDIRGTSPTFLSAGVGGAMALSATNIIGAVSSPNTISSLSNNSFSHNRVENDNLKAKPVDSKQIDDFPISTENKQDVLIDQSHKIKNFHGESVNIGRATPPCFIVGCADEDDEESAKSAKAAIAKFSTKSTPSPSINESFIQTSKRNEVQKGNGLKPTIDFEYFTKKPSIVLPKGIPLPSSLSFSRKRQIKFRRKVYEFFVAPITTFWSWTLSFVAFLVALTYVLLIRTPLHPTYVEWYLLAYVITFGMETIRKFFMSEPKKFKEKVEYFFANYWNFITSVAIIGFLIGFGFRVYPPTRKSVGRVILAVDSVLWSIKLLDFLGVHPRFGPYITMAAKMVMNMSSMVVMLLISLLAFGLVRQSITFPDEEWNWLLVRNIFYKPYFMLYGEVYADEIDVCGDEAWDEHMESHIPINGSTSGDACVPGHWIPPLLMTVFLLIANILLISMLIAIFNNIFEQTIKISQQIWLFQRYRQVMEYEGTPFLPPPFTPVYHAFMFAKYLRYRQCCCHSRRSLLCIFRRIARCCCCCCVKPKKTVTKKREQPGGAHPSQTNTHHSRTICRRGDNGLALFDFSLKLFLSEDQVEKLHDFEEECMEDMARNKEIERARSSEERLHRTAERTDLILTRLNDLTSKEMQLKGNIHEIETRMETMESKQIEMLECMRQITLALPSIIQSLQNISSASSPPTQYPIMPSAQEPQNMPTSAADENQKIGGILPAQLNELDAQSSLQCSEDPSTSIHAADRIRRRNTARNSTSTQLEKRRANTDLMTGSDGSSQTTVFYPLMQASSTGNANVHQRGRARTTTIGGNESASNAMLSADGQNRLFGSLISLNPAATTSNNGNMRNRKNSSIRRRRRHDEYTSITDAIDIDNIVVTTSTYNITSAAAVPKVQAENGGSSDPNNKADSIGSTRPTSILAPELRRRAALKIKTASTEGDQIVSPVAEIKDIEDDADVEDLEEADDEQEEEEEDDEADYDDDEEEDEDEEYEFHISACSTSLNVGLLPTSSDIKRLDQLDYSYLNGIVTDQIGLTHRHHQITGRADETENELVDVENNCVGSRENNDDDDNDNPSSTAPSSQNSTVHRAGTPNTVLKRARASFIRHQNMLFKDYEEEVGRPLEMQSIPTNSKEPDNKPPASKSK